MKLRIDSTIRAVGHLVKGRDILDIGNKGMAHPGTMAGELQRLAAGYVGIDEEENAELFDLGRVFEVITCFEVLEHLDNVGLCLERVKAHLSPKGVFICSVPNIKSPYHLVVAQTRWHVSCFDAKTLRQRLERHFKKVKVRRINFGRNLLAVCQR